MHSKPRLLRLLIGSLIPLHAVLVLARDAPSPVPTPVLVELFTSEGCSSCPPADALLRQIDGRRTDAGQLIIGISEHVTYWNSMGWSDPYSSAIYTERQAAYGRRFALDSVYTPQMVVNGAVQLVGINKDALLHTLEQASQRPPRSLLIVSALIAGDTLNVHFSAALLASDPAADIMAVLTDDSDRSSVLRGENSGRTLAHVSVARAMAKVATIHVSGEKTVQIKLPNALRREPHSGHHLILFAQAGDSGPVLAVATMPL